MSATTVQDTLIKQLRSDTNMAAAWDDTLTGTFTFTSASAIVAGVGTLFTTELAVKDYIYAPTAAKWLRIKSIESDLSLTLYSNFTDTTEPGVASKVTNIRKGIPRNLRIGEMGKSIGVYRMLGNYSQTTLPHKNQTAIYPFLVVGKFYEPDEDEAENRKDTYEDLMRRAIEKNLLMDGLLFNSRIGDTRFYIHAMEPGVYYIAIPFVAHEKKTIG